MIVIDASVAIKWVVREADHEAALTVVDKPWARVAPDLLLPEVTNVLRKKQRAQEITVQQARSGLAAVKSAIGYYIPSLEIADDAAILAQELDHSPYDCFYLACALGRGVLLSADEVFVKKCKSCGYAEFVASLDDVGCGRLDARLAAKLIRPQSLETIQRLVERIDATFRSLKDAANISDSAQLRITDSRTFAPAFESPAYRRLSAELESMDVDTLGVVIALGWLGRSYHSIGDWVHLHEQARWMAEEGFKAHGAYFIAQMGRVTSGMEKLRGHLFAAENDSN